MNARDCRRAIAAALLPALWAAAGRGETPVQAAPPEPVQPPAAGPGEAAVSPLPQQLCDALHTIAARRRAQCCGTAPASLAAVCTRELASSLARGAVRLDAGEIQACSAAVSLQLQGCDWVTPLPPALPAACRGLVGGLLAAGAGCRSSLECGDGLYCRGASLARQGVCAAPAAARARCEVPADNLAAFARARDDPRHPACAGVCVRGQCLPLAAAGEACVSSARCAAGLHCVSGVCQDRPPPAAGESCAGQSICAEGAFCQAGRCVALKGEGEPCHLPFECRGRVCEKAAGAPAGRCGSPCGSTAPARARDAAPPAGRPPI